MDMNLSKGIIYLLICVSMLLAGMFFNELGIISTLLTYIGGVGVGFVIWNKDRTAKL